MAIMFFQAVIIENMFYGDVLPVFITGHHIVI